ncbi:MAG: leucine-rich repeat domain-containing protein [Clostridia bacterium]|nr:leucine-rich repeat domain-containing protein [Clostridia bacterium]
MKANLKKLISVSLCLLLLLGSVAAGGAGISEALDSFTLKASAENDIDDFTFSYEEDYAVVTGYTGESDSITIPEEAEGLPVKEIGAGAFSSVDFIFELFIPASVVSVGANAFNGCDLWDIYYYGRPGALAVDSTGNDSFDLSAIQYKYAPFTFTVNETESTAEITDCDQSVTGILEIPSEIYSYTVTSLGSYAVDRCQNITGVILPSTLKTIGSYSFYRCQSLKEVTVPEGVTKVDYTAFGDCWSL